ncbi:MAG TPA: alpha/beta hydrolase [Pirellulales bacterium]|jgi:hypothetical protein|nr:alpha/beta hydrolase [Pirellulales bacterium]
MTTPSRIWQRLAKLALVIAIAYVLVVMSLLFLQTAMIFPGAGSQGTAEARVEPGPGAELLTLTTSAGERVAALFGKALTDDGQANPDADARPTLLFFYGNGMYLGASEDLFEWFRTLGFNVLMPDYVGYGMSTGRPSEQGCYDTANAAYDWLAMRTNFDSQRVIVAGWSLGGAVAIDLAARMPVGGLMVLSSFTNLVELAKAHYPFLPVKQFLKYGFDSEQKIASVKCPIVIGYGDRDDLVAPEMSRRLAKAVKTAIELFDVPGAGHNDFFEHGQRQIAEHLQALARRLPN